MMSNLHEVTIFVSTLLTEDESKSKDLQGDRIHQRQRAANQSTVVTRIQ